MDTLVTLQQLQQFYKGRKVFVTGHTGFKGSWLSILLHQLGAEVYGYALAPATNPSLYALANIDQYVKSTLADIRDYDRLEKALTESQAEIIFHMAAQPLVLESYKNPRETYEVNVMGTVNVLEATRSVSGVKAIVNVTSDKCYENKEWIWGYREHEPMGGYDPYSSSKGCSELVTSAFRNSFYNPNQYPSHGVAVASARAGNVIGGGDWAEDRLIPDFIRSIIKGEELKLRNPKAIRPWQHVLEPLTGYLELAKALVESGSEFAEGWNFGPNEQDAQHTEWIIQHLCTLWGDQAAYSIQSDPQVHEAHYLKLDCSKAKARLGWQPRLQIIDALQLVVDWNKAWLKKEDVYQISLRQIDHYYSLTERK